MRMYQSCSRPLDVLSLLSSQDRLEMLVSVGAKSLRGHQVRGHQVQVHGCEKKFGQKSDVSLVLGSSARHAWMGRPPTERRPIREYGRKPNIPLSPGWDNQHVILILFVKECHQNSISSYHGPCYKTFWC